MTDKQKIIELQRELNKIKEAADMALSTYCQTDELHDDVVASINGQKPKNLILNSFYTVWGIPVDVQVLDGQVNIIDIFKLTGKHTKVDLDHRFIEDVCMRDEKTITIHYGS